MYGLKEEELTILQNSFLKYPSIKQVILYGSRAIGNFKQGSDIDIVIIGDEDLKDKIFYIYDEIEEKLSYFVDISLYDFITNKKLKEHIKKVGKVIYRKRKTGNLSFVKYTQ